jgi:chromosome segregation ATPase
MKKDEAADQVIQTDLSQYLADQRFNELNQHIGDEGVRRQLRELANRLLQAQSQVQTLTQQASAAEEQRAAAEENVNRLQIASDFAKREARERAAEAQSYKTANATLTADLSQQLTQAQDLREQLFDREKQIEQMVAKQDRTLAQLGEYMRAMQLVGKDVNEVLQAEDGPPIVQGKVMGTRTADGLELVEISIGSDDGLVKGHMLDVFNTEGRGKWLGQVQVFMTTPDKAVCIVQKDTQQGRIREGDYVTTKL